jgi:hypothetical protein
MYGLGWSDRSRAEAARQTLRGALTGGLRVAPHLRVITDRPPSLPTVRPSSDDAMEWDWIDGCVRNTVRAWYTRQREINQVRHTHSSAHTPRARRAKCLRGVARGKDEDGGHAADNGRRPSDEWRTAE